MARNGTLKALTISQPYARLIASGEKFVENRTWKTKYRGPLFIHAGKGRQYLTAQQLRGYVTGAIVASCELIASIELINPTNEDHEELEKHGMTLQEVLDHSYCEGPVAWVLYEVRKCSEPYFIDGNQGIW